MNSQIDKQHQQQQVILKYIEGIIRDNSLAGKTMEGSTSHTKSGDTMLSEVSNDSKTNKRHEDVKPLDRNRFFKIHDLIDSKNLTIAVISFDGPALDWYRSNDELEAFKNWDDLKRGCWYNSKPFEMGR
ncbi:transposon Tf2-1 polyprotein isoform X1 [Cucumis melo var. makuwa]|uniref:Transposon Tf2-1 polyprotein isoform X1 n=1 Tax=Cucumis melo var. makuwa TaxID=1194695 RepID=A0A5A7VPV4_CUCMM|nr:transposon Tf2-1 polyprotein isoform X1 [Cucumis melo var. makuwa]TYJ97159.1 transposon Tf2-1 polyprotein isoform X1 [Cucumis melo var. makuwa]